MGHANKKKIQDGFLCPTYGKIQEDCSFEYDGSFAIIKKKIDDVIAASPGLTYEDFHFAGGGWEGCDTHYFYCFRPKNQQEIDQEILTKKAKSEKLRKLRKRKEAEERELLEKLKQKYEGEEKRSTFSQCSPGVGDRKTDV
jgi:hypothetical protein